MSRDSHSSVMKPLLVLAVPGMYLMYKYNQYKRQRSEQKRRKYAEKELQTLNHRIDKLLDLLDKQPKDGPLTQENECVVCMDAPATMTTYPCNHRVICRRCFVKTIQSAVCQRSLPLRCVMCRAKIIKLKQTSKDVCHDNQTCHRQSNHGYHKGDDNIYGSHRDSSHGDRHSHHGNHYVSHRNNPSRPQSTSDPHIIRTFYR